MKKVLTLILTLLILSSIAVHAAEIPEDRQLPLLVDDADILSVSVENALLSLLGRVSLDTGCDVAVVTVNSLGRKSAQAYADDFYDYNGYGSGDGDDGILLLVAMDEREWAFSTYGTLIRAIPNYALDDITDEIVPYLSSGDYYEAFTTYADLVLDYVEYYRANGQVLGYDGDSELSVAEKVGTSAVIAAIIALVVMLTIKSGMRTIKQNNFAKYYVVNNSLKLRVSRETFLYRNVTRIRRETESSSSGTHRSSSGRSHGGRSGRF